MSDVFKDGGPAFPLTFIVRKGNKSPFTGKIVEADEEHIYSGASLRDLFAGMALSSIRVGDWSECKNGAKWAYDYADAMLAERNK